MFAIALISLKEALRKRILLAGVVFAAAVILTAPLWPALIDADRVKLIEDISLSTMALVGMIAAVCAAAWSLPADIEEKRILTLASKPVRLHTILLGKLLGFLATLAIMLLIITALSDIVIRVFSTHLVVEVTQPDAPVMSCDTPDMSGDSQIATAQEGLELRVTGRIGGYYEVAIPPELGVAQTTGRIWADDATTPRRRYLAARRLAAPSEDLLSNTGRASHTADTLVLETGNTAVGEIWRFSGIDPAALPHTPDVPVLLRVPGILGADNSDRWGQFDQAEIGTITAVVRAVDPASGRSIDAVQTSAAWRADAFELGLQLPRQMLLGGSIQLAVAETQPQFIHKGTHSIQNGRVLQWRFRGLKHRRFPRSNTVTGELNIALHPLDAPLEQATTPQEDRRPAVTLRIATPARTRSETISVPVSDARASRFAFSRELIDSGGGVDISLLDVPEAYVAEVPGDATALRLVEKPALFEWSFLKAAAFIYCRIMIVATIAISASTFLSGNIAALAAFVICLCGMLAGFLSRILLIGPRALMIHDYGRIHGEGIARATWPVAEAAIRLLTAILPDLSRLSGKRYIIDGLDVPGRLLLGGIGATLIYCAGCLLIALLILRRKEVG